MFDVCFDCDCKLIEQKGSVCGYWGDTTIEFISLPKYQCSSCDNFYLEEKIAILTQEITRALIDSDLVPEIVDISNSYELLSKNLDKIYDLIQNKRIYLVKVGNKIIINQKDVNSLFYDDSALLAARNKAKITDDVEREINSFCKK